MQVSTDPKASLLDLAGLAGPRSRSDRRRTHRIIRICERQGVPIVADRAYIGVGSWVTTAIRRPPQGELSPTERTLNRALAQARAPVDRGVARLKS